MKQQYQFEVVHDAVSYAVAEAPRLGIKVGNRAYAAAAVGSWMEAVKPSVRAFEAVETSMQPIPDTTAGAYLDLLG